jgi:alpha-1,2-mannosyltransferase
MPKLMFALCLCALAACCFIAYALIWESFDDFDHSIDHCDRPFCDFGDCYYPMAARVLEDPRPVEGFFYPPFFALALRPLALLPLTTATWIWGLLNVPLSLLLMVAPFVLPGARRDVIAWAAVPLFLLCYPVLHNFKWGQVSVLVTILVLGAFWASARRRYFVSGIVLGLAASVKFYPVLYLPWFILKRDWRHAGRTISSFFLSASFSSCARRWR